MDETISDNTELVAKIARLVQERGLNQGDFARMARLNRHTARQILLPGGTRHLRNATINGCARALGLTVNELRTQPLERLLPRMVDGAAGGIDDPARRLHEQATQPELKSWTERNRDRARRMSEEEIDELLALQGEGGPLATLGVDAFVERIERRRRLMHQVRAIAGTEYLELLEQLVALLFEKVHPGQKG
jgi:hypothetical protein